MKNKIPPITDFIKVYVDVYNCGRELNIELMALTIPEKGKECITNIKKKNILGLTKFQ